MSLRVKCLLYLVATAILWSMSGVLIKSIDWNPLAIASSRSFVAMLTIAFLARKTIDWSLPNKPQWVGAICMALLSAFFVIATKLTTAANAILLQYTAPVWVALLAPLILHERTNRRDWFFILIVFAGMGLFFIDHLSTEGLLGMFFAILSGVAFAGLSISIRYVKDNQPFKLMIYGNMLMLAAGLFFWRPPWPSPTGISLILFAGVVQFGISYYLFTLASKEATSLELVLITMIEPILNPVWVFLIVGEKPGLWSMLGGAVVVLTVTSWSVLKVIKPTPALPANLAVAAEENNEKSA